ncbi:hypothetical protein [Cyclobacterium sediminis]
MMVKKSRRIILAEKRKEEHLEGEYLSRYSINYKEKDNHSIMPVSSLYLFQETTLGAGKMEQLMFDENILLLILPVIGRVQVQNREKQYEVDIGGALLLPNLSRKSCTISNEFENSDVHYLIAGFACNEPTEGLVQFLFCTDKLEILFEGASQCGLIKAVVGQWKGRAKGEYVSTTPNIFAWVIQGAFEIENCLLQKSDGLAVFQSEKIEFEALSNNAIIIFLEMA